MTATSLPSMPPVGPTPTKPSAPSSSRFSPIDPLRIVRQHWILLVVTLMIGGILGGGVWFILNRFDNSYVSSMRLKVQPGDPKAYGQPVDLSQGMALDIIAAIIRNESLNITSDTTLTEAFNKDDIKRTRWFQSFDSPEWDDAGYKFSQKLRATQLYTRSRLQELENRTNDPVQKSLPRQFVELSPQAVEEMAQRLEPLHGGSSIQSAGNELDKFAMSQLVDKEDSIQRNRVAAAKYNLQTAGGLSAVQIRGSTQIRVSFYASREFKNDMKNILNSLVLVYINRLQENQKQKNLQLRQVFNDELRRADADLSNIVKELRRFQDERNLPSLQTTNHEYSMYYSKLAQGEADLRIRVANANDALRAREESVNSPVKMPVSPQDTYRAENAQSVQRIDEELRAAKLRLETMENDYGPNSPVIINQKTQIRVLEEQREHEITHIIDMFNAAMLGTMRGEVEDLKAQLGSVGKQLDEARKQMRELSTMLQEYELIAERQNTVVAKRNKAVELLNDIRILENRPDAVKVDFQETAGEPELSWPHWYVVMPVVALLVWLVVVGIVFMKELLDQRIKSPADIRLLPNMEILGVVPHATEDPSGPARIDSVVHKDPSGLMAESFRQVRTALLARIDRRGYKTIMFTSARPQSGTSSVLSNLAISIAYNGRKVLVIDANFRRPSQNTAFGGPLEPGLVEVLRGTASVESAIYRHPDFAVDVLPTGAAKEAAPELLESSAFRNLISQIEGSYDMILIDCPPVLLASDGQMLAKHADAVVLVVRAMAEERGMVSRMFRSLDGYRAEVLGVVLNSARSSAGGYFRKSYQQFYNYRQSAAPRRMQAGPVAARPAAATSRPATSRAATSRPATSRKAPAKPSQPTSSQDN